MEGAGVLTVQLESYYNPKGGKNLLGNYCDGVGSVRKDSDCDVWFEFCFRKYPVHDRSTPCDFNLTTYVLGGDAFLFPRPGQIIGPNVTNPLVYKFDYKWQVSSDFIFCKPWENKLFPWEDCLSP